MMRNWEKNARLPKRVRDEMNCVTRSSEFALEFDLSDGHEETELQLLRGEGGRGPRISIVITSSGYVNNNLGSRLNK